MGIDSEQQLAAVFLSVDEGDEVAARIGAQDVLQNARIVVVLDVLATIVAKRLQRIGTGRPSLGGGTCLLDLVVSTVSETQRQGVKALDDLVSVLLGKK